MKSDSHLDRNYLKGALGDQINAVLSGVGYTFRAILRKLRLLWLYIQLTCLAPFNVSPLNVEAID